MKFLRDYQEQGRPRRTLEPSSIDYPGQTSLGHWVADKLRAQGVYKDMEEQVELAIATELLSSGGR